MKHSFLIALLPVLLFCSCGIIDGERIKGNGNVVTEERGHTGFTGVDVRSALQVYITQDSAYSVKVEADENLQDYIITSLEKDILQIRTESNTSLDATGRIKIHVSAPFFSDLMVSGASELTGRSLITSDKDVEFRASGASKARLDLKAPKIAATASGASSITLTGETKDLFVRGSGASGIHCFELLSENTDVSVSGASSAYVFASVLLKANASGASHVQYKGSAATVNQSASGAGSIKKAD